MSFLVFEVDLKESRDVSLRKLERKLRREQQRAAAAKQLEAAAAPSSDDGAVASAAATDEGEPPAPAPALPSADRRYNVIERLELLYCGGVNQSDGDEDDEDEDDEEDGADDEDENEGEEEDAEEDEDDDENSALNADSQDDGNDDEGDDDECEAGVSMSTAPSYYDTNDSFIDDSELLEKRAKRERAKRTKTKFSGFFVNAGNLDTEGGDDEAHERDWGAAALPSAPPPKRPKHMPPLAAAASGQAAEVLPSPPAVWQPNPAALGALTTLSQRANELRLSAPAAPQPLLPRALQDALWACDSAVRLEHGDAWECDGYWNAVHTAVAMTSEQLTHAVVKATLEMRALGTRAAASRKDADDAETRMTSHVRQCLATQPLPNATEPSIEPATASEDTAKFTWTKEVKEALGDTIVAVESWVVCTNEHRQLLRSPNGKLAAEAVAVGVSTPAEAQQRGVVFASDGGDGQLAPLQQRLERTKLMTRLAALWPSEWAIDSAALQNAYAGERERRRKARKREERTAERHGTSVAPTPAPSLVLGAVPRESISGQVPAEAKPVAGGVPSASLGRLVCSKALAPAGAVAALDPDPPRAVPLAEAQPKHNVSAASSSTGNSKGEKKLTVLDELGAVMHVPIAPKRANTYQQYVVKHHAGVAAATLGQPQQEVMRKLGAAWKECSQAEKDALDQAAEAEHRRAMAQWLDPTTGPGRETERTRICSRAQLAPSASWVEITEWARDRVKKEKAERKANSMT